MLLILVAHSYCSFHVACEELNHNTMHPSLSACMREVAVAGCLSILSFRWNRRVDAGAITAHSLVDGPGATAKERIDRILQALSKLAGR
jgi:hypothetical protein